MSSLKLLPGNDSPLDALLFTFNRVDPPTFYATSLIGALLQCLTFGCLIIVSIKYYFTFLGKDNYITVARATALIMLTIATVVLTQRSTYRLLYFVDAQTGTGIQKLWESDRDDHWKQNFILGVAQPLALSHFATRLYELWGRRVWVGAGMAVLTVGWLGIAVGSIAYCYAAEPDLKVNGEITLAFAASKVPEWRHYSVTAFRLVTAWACYALCVDGLVLTALIVGIQRHRRKATALSSLKLALQRGVLYITESMALPVVIHLVYSILLFQKMGIGSAVRTLSRVQMPLTAFAVILSLVSREDIQRLLLESDTTISSSVSHSSGVLKRVSMYPRSPMSPSYTKSGTTSPRPIGLEDEDKDFELGPFDSNRSLVKNNPEDEYHVERKQTRSQTKSFQLRSKSDNRPLEIQVSEYAEQLVSSPDAVGGSPHPPSDDSSSKDPYNSFPEPPAEPSRTRRK